jgi:hypothetical protein
LAAPSLSPTSLTGSHTHHHRGSCAAERIKASAGFGAAAHATDAWVARGEGIMTDLCADPAVNSMLDELLQEPASPASSPCLPPPGSKLGRAHVGHERCRGLQAP